MASESLHHFKDILIVLGTAGVVIPLLLRFGISSILGFLFAGVLLGPHVLGPLANQVPALSNLTISDPEAISSLAELGIVFLLFLIGIELSPERLLTMRRLVFGLGGLQVMISGLAIATVALLLNYTTLQALIIGFALALSSTAIVIQIYADQKRLGSQSGRISFAILLLQDLMIVPLLLLVAALGASENENIWQGVGLAVLQALAAGAAIVIIGRLALTPLLRLVARAQSPDLFMASVLFIAVGTGAAAAWAGLSMSLGAFIAGLMLAETEYRRAIEAIIEPFKGLLLGLFFLLVGLSLDLSLLSQKPLQIIAASGALIAVKAIIILVLCRLFKLPNGSSFEAALMLGPGGEFAFVLLSAAVAEQLLSPAESRPVLLVVTLTMLAIPFMSMLARTLRPKVEKGRKPLGQPISPPPTDDARVIIAGFGRVGSLVASMLEEQKIPFIAVDSDIEHVSRARKEGKQVYFGDAADPAFLHACDITRAKALAITMDNPARVDDILRTARALKPDLKIIARARDERHAIMLYDNGATEAVPETIEASLHLGEALLVEVGVPMGLAIAAVHERRDEYRKLLGQTNRREMVKRRRKVPGPKVD